MEVADGIKAKRSASQSLASEGNPPGAQRDIEIESVAAGCSGPLSTV